MCCCFAFLNFLSSIFPFLFQKICHYMFFLMLDFPICSVNRSVTSKRWDMYEGHSVFLSLMIVYIFMFTRDLFHFNIVNCTFNLTKDKIQYRYDNLFAHFMKWVFITIPRYTASLTWAKSRTKNPCKSGVYFNSTLSSCSSRYHIWGSFL